MSDLDVLLVGPLPPPFGGVSAHVERLARAIQRRGMTVGVADHFRSGDPDPVVIAQLARNPWRYWRVGRRARARVIHYHHARWSTLLATALALRNSPSTKLVTVHGRELEPYLNGRLPGVGKVTARALRRFDVLIAVSAEIERSLAPLGRPVRLIPAFIPAEQNEADLPGATRSFLAGGTNLITAAYRLSTDRQGRTIYGLEIAIESFAALAADRQELRLGIFVADVSRRGSDRLDRLIERVRDGAIRARIRVFYGQPLLPALAMATVYLRPTLTDGDAVSVREAIAAGVPVLASDVVGRPAGVRTVPVDTARWIEAIEETLAADRSTSLAATAVPRANIPATAADPLNELIALYEALCRRPEPPRGQAAPR